MEEKEPEIQDNKKRQSAGTNRSNTLTMLFYVIGVFTIFAIGFIVILIRSKG